VNLTNRQSGQTRSTKTNNEGHYVFTELLPGTFSMTVDAPGFKRFEQQEVVVTATERVTVPVLVAGNPKDQIEALRAAGVQGFVHLFSDAIETLTEWQTRLGMRSTQ